MKLLKSKRTVAVWGSSEPKQLLEIFSYLNAHGFIGPSSSSTLYSFSFTRRVDEDLDFLCRVTTAGGDPVRHTVHIDTFLGLVSKSLLLLKRQTKLVDPAVSDPKEYAAGIFSVTLAHLKWNAEGGDVNPSWTVSPLPEFDSAALDWIHDWEKYAVPVIDAIKDLPSAIAFGEQVMYYQKNPWVRSTGWVSAALECYLSLLLFKINQVGAAKDLLRSAFHATDRPAKQSQILLVSEWIDAQSQGKA